MLKIDNLSLSLPGFHLKNISFEVADGEYFILLGESGAGKSLLLEAIAGLNKIHEGSIKLKGKEISNEKIQQREIGLVFQDHAVFPHLTVNENISYPLKHRHLTAEERSKRIKPIISTLQISHLLNRRPATLSGGELQRVALARALVQKPKVLLLDEPLASIDSMLKSDLRALLRQINRDGQTIIHVTHDFDEAVSLADRIAIIDNGKIVQTGTPHEVFSNPVSGFVAHFAGIRNFFRVGSEERHDLVTAYPHENVPITLNCVTNSDTGYLLIRNEDILLSAENFESSALNNFEGIVEDIYPVRNGEEVVVNIGIPLHAQVSRESAEKLGLQRGKTIWVHFKASAAKLITV